MCLGGGSEFGTGLLDELCEMHRRSASKRDRASLERTKEASPGGAQRGGREELASSQFQVSYEEKERVVGWLEELRLVRAGAVKVEDLPAFCRNGVLLCDLVNRAEGRGEPKIKGCWRNPRSLSEVKANLRKVLGYLRRLERLPKDHLWSPELILQGDDQLIWGLLDDLRRFYRVQSTPRPLPRGAGRKPPHPRRPSQPATGPGLSEIEIKQTSSPTLHVSHSFSADPAAAQAPPQYFSTRSAQK